MAKLPAVTTITLKKTLKSPAVLIDFWASWCGPCQALTPILQQLKKELGSRVRIVGANVDKAPKLAERFGITSIPALLFFKDGQEIHRQVGGVPRQKLRQDIKEHLGV